MSREKIFTMPVGKEMDDLMAEEVMGWRRNDRTWDDDTGFCAYNEKEPWEPHFQPSTEIEYAWEVHRTMISESIFSVRQRYFKELQNAVSVGLDYTVAWPDVLVYLGPEHICRAALLTKSDD